MFVIGYALKYSLLGIRQIGNNQSTFALHVTRNEQDDSFDDNCSISVVVVVVTNKTEFA